MYSRDEECSDHCVFTDVQYQPWRSGINYCRSPASTATKPNLFPTTLHKERNSYSDRQTDRQTSHTHRLHTKEQPDRQTDKQTADKQTDRQTQVRQTENTFQDRVLEVGISDASNDNYQTLSFKSIPRLFFFFHMVMPQSWPVLRRLTRVAFPLSTRRAVTRRHHRSNQRTECLLQ